MNAPSSDLRARVLANAGERAAPTRRGQRVRFAIVLVAAALGLGALGGMHGLDGVRARPEAYTTILFTVFALVLLWLCAPLLAFRRSPLGPDRARVSRRAFQAPALLAAGALAGNLVAPESAGHGGLGIAAHMVCFGLTFVSGSLVSALALWFMRGSDPVAPGALGALLGAVAGTAAAFAMSLACPHAEPLHVLGTHVLTVLLLIVGARVLGTRILRAPAPTAASRP